MSSLTNPHISFNITTHFNDGRIGQMPGEDDFCKWMDVVQNDTLRCPPKEGKATLSSTALLLGGWVPEVGRPTIPNDGKKMESYGFFRPIIPSTCASQVIKVLFSISAQSSK